MHKLGIDPKKFKYLKSDDKSTTLQHKDGHTLTIAHNILSPANQEVLKALSVVNNQKPKMADGGETPHWSSARGLPPAGPHSSNPHNPDYSDKAPAPEASEPSKPPEKDPQDEGYTDYPTHLQQAKGGKIEGISQQGRDVRHANEVKRGHSHSIYKNDPHGEMAMDFAKDEAKGRAQHERESVKPNLKGLADGGKIPSEGDVRKEKGFWESEHGKQALAAQHKELENIRSKKIKPHQSHKQNYADGGDVEQQPPQQEQPQANSNPNAPINLTINTGQPGQQPQIQQDNQPHPQAKQPEKQQAQPMMAQQQPPQAPQQAAIAMPANQQQQPQLAQPQQPAAVPAALNPMDMPDVQSQPPEYQKAYADYKADHMQELAQENAAFEHDLNNGHITPETYKSLFAKKDTLGKIGTLFGLLVSGAGSGLTHQPNAVMEMMQKQIDNDLKAQTTSKENAQNFHKLHQAQALNDATIKQLERQGNLTEAQALKTFTETQQIPRMTDATINQMVKQGLLTDASAQNIKSEASARNYALDQAKLLQSSYHSLVDQTNKMPEGPQKEIARQQLGMMYSKMADKINNVNDTAAGASAYYNTLFGNQQPGAQSNNQSPDEASFQKRQSGLMALGQEGQARAQFENERHMPGVPEISGQMASRPIPEAVRGQVQAMQVLGDKGKDLLKYAQANKGSVNPKVLKVGEQKAEEMMNYYNKSIEGGVMTEGRLAWLDKQIKKNPTSIFQDILGNNAQLSEIINSNDNRKNILLKSVGFNPKQQAASSQQQQQPEGDTIERMDKQGRTIIYDAKTKKPLRVK